MLPSIIFRLGALACLTASAAAQIGAFSIPSNYTSFNFTTWTVSTNQLTQFQYQARLPLTNGYHGLALAPEGTFYGEDKNLTDPSGVQPLNGWPLFDPRTAFASCLGFWDEQKNTSGTNFPELLKKGGESVISGIPHGTGILFTVGNNQTYQAGVDKSTISNYWSTFSFRNGLYTVFVTWTPKANGTAYNITMEAFASAPRLNIAVVRSTIIASHDSEVKITDILDGRSALRSQAGPKGLMEDENMQFSSVQANGLDGARAYVVSTVDFEEQVAGVVDISSRKQVTNESYIPGNASTIAQQFSASLKANEILVVEKFVGIASSDAFGGKAEDVAMSESLAAKAVGYGGLLKEHNEAWERKWAGGVDLYVADGEVPTDDSIAQLQISTIASQYYLLSNLREGSEGPNIGDRSISVSGQASDSYGGQIFWDADVWMFPSINPSHPEYARNINNYRSSLHPAALENAAENGYPNGSSLYPWTSARFGNCTATGPCVDYEYHLNSDINLALVQSYLTTGNVSFLRDEVWPILRSSAEAFEHLLEYNDTLQRYTTVNMTDPDEYANHEDNGAFTNAGIIKTFEFATQVGNILGEAVPDSWLNKSKAVEIPYDADTGIIKEYSTMNGSLVIKQADVVLLNFPLDYRISSAQALRDLDYYAQAQSPDGPAMTWSIIAIDAAQLSPSGCSSFTYAMYAFLPYIRAPWYQFSEQLVDDPNTNGNTNPAYPFLTGHGGFNQIGKYGFAGLRLNLESLHLDPYLPPQIPQLNTSMIHYMGSTLIVQINQQTTNITRIPTTNPSLTEPQGPITVEIGARNPKAGNYSLSVGDSIIIPTTLYHQVRTIEGNLVQCSPIVAHSGAYLQGQFPLAAVDGANSTKWMPESGDPASITVDMGTQQELGGAFFNWAAAPPLSYTIEVSNSSSTGFQNISSASNITISNPANATLDAMIRPKEGNTTAVKFESIASGRYVRLTVEGTQGEKKSSGCSVAEFAVLPPGNPIINSTFT